MSIYLILIQLASAFQVFLIRADVGLDYDQLFRGEATTTNHNVFDIQTWPYRVA